MTSQHFKFIQDVSLNLVERFHVASDVADFIGCQFALESSFGSSELAKEFNNFSGMKTPLVRISVALNYGCSSISDKWAKYRSPWDCLLDYMLCLQYHRPLACTFESIQHFKSFIKFYCPDKSYTDKINSIYVQFKQTLKTLNNANTK